MGKSVRSIRGLNFRKTEYRQKRRSWNMGSLGVGIGRSAKTALLVEANVFLSVSLYLDLRDTWIVATATTEDPQDDE